MVVLEEDRGKNVLNYLKGCGLIMLTNYMEVYGQI